MWDPFLHILIAVQNNSNMANHSIIVTPGPTEFDSITANYSGFYNAAMSHYPVSTYKPYQVVWTPKVVFQVTMIVIVMVLALIGNTTLIAIITFHRKLRHKRVNVFLVNLAIGDLTVCLITMTTEILFVAFGEWVLGAVACKLLLYGQIVTLASATFLLTAMSIDRYQVLVRPLQALTGQPKIWRKVLIAWAMAFIFATPQMLIFVQTSDGVQPDGHIKYKCQSKGYTAQWQRKAYFTFLTTYILIIPTIIMSFCYINIIKVVWMRSYSKRKTKPKFRIRFSTNRKHFSQTSDSLGTEHELKAVNPYGSDGNGSQNLVKHREAVHQNKLSLPKKLVSSSKRNVVKMTLSVIMGFVICWTPYFVVSLVRIYSDYQIKLRNALTVAEIMCQLHSALNPILYGIFSTKAAKKVCRHMCRKCRRSEEYIARYETTALSDEDTTWVETKFTRIHQGTDFSNTNCNAHSDRQNISHLHHLVSLIKQKCSRKRSPQPVTKIVSQYSQLVLNDEHSQYEHQRSYIEIADRAHLISPGNRDCIIANNCTTPSPQHHANAVNSDHHHTIMYSDILRGQNSKGSYRERQLTNPSTSAKCKEKSHNEQHSPSSHVSWEDGEVAYLHAETDDVSTDTHSKADVSSSDNESDGHSTEDTHAGGSSVIEIVSCM